jgi:NADPH2:quinone reductase
MNHKRIIVNRQRELEVVEEGVPAPRPGEVRLRMLAAGVSFPDVMMRQGVHPEARKPPFTPGWDVVGVVDELGEGVRGVPLGTKVAAMPIVGCYAEYLCLPETELVRVPPQLDPAEAVCLILNYVTAYQMLHRSAQAKPDETALVHGAAGGVGTALLQLAKLSGVKTFGTASTKKLKVVESLGGQAIDYKKCDFLKAIRSTPEGAVDIVFDAIGGWNLIRSFRALRKGGRLVAYGFSSVMTGGNRDLKKVISTATGCATAFALKLLSRSKRITIYSIQTLKRRNPDWFRQDLTTLFGLLERGDLKPLVDRRLPLEQAAVAQELVGKGETVGKIVLVGQEQLT